MFFSNFLAPLHDYTDLPFRLLCQRYGAESACVPLVSSAALANDKKNLSLVDAHPDERNVGVQLVGADPESIAKAAAIISESMPFVRWLNINCGCPSVRTTLYGGGCAMLKTPEKIVQAVELVKKETDVPLSVKIRIDKKIENSISLCKKLERSGADFLIVHGRTTNQGYSGKADWEAIKKINEGVSVPVVGNGDISSASEGSALVEKNYCDSFMIGRAAMANPMVFSDKKPENLAGRFALLREYLSLHEKYAGEPELRDVRLKAVSIISSVKGASVLRAKICLAKTSDEIFALDASQKP